ncbi:MAG TPA: DNA methyltransferase [Candidatus Limnocylindrales bacterium]|nr:DNA methyltransferase [Candidatus Limnocylindrales bacterium]
MELFQSAPNQVINDDCLHALPEIPGGSVDLVLTDPPYLVNYHDRSGRSLAGDSTGYWVLPAFAEIARVLKPDHLCVSFCAWNKTEQFLAAWRTVGLRIVGQLVWVKPYPSSSGLLAYRHEQAYLLAKGHPGKPVEALPDVLPWQYTGNRLHPTEKPVSSLTPVVEAFTRPGDIVLDPFCGSGSTLLAAKLLGRRYVGIEIDAGHCRTARARL